MQYPLSLPWPAWPGLPGLPGSFTQGLGLGSPPISREGRLDELNQGLVDVVVPFARAYAAKGVNVRGEAEEAAFARGRTPAVLGPDERGAAVRKLAGAGWVANYPTCWNPVIVK